MWLALALTGVGKEQTRILPDISAHRLKRVRARACPPNPNPRVSKAITGR